MGRSGGCCLGANCTAPPCPSGTCCHIDKDTFYDIDTIGIDRKTARYKCEENSTENCCLSKPFSLFNKATTSCGEIELCPNQSSLVIPTVFNTDKAFALLKHNGSVVAWGDSATGGSVPSDLSNVVDIFSNPVAFVALKKDGTAVPWGDASKGGSFLPNFTPGEDPDTLDNIKSVIGSAGAFVAIKTDGTVIAWGDAAYGGVIPSSIKNLLVGIVEVVSTDRYFAARNTDGEIFIWGNGAKAYDKRDTNKSASVTSLDALQIINFLSRYGEGVPGGLTLEEFEEWAEANPNVAASIYSSAFDVNRSGTVTALDALLVINGMAVIGGPSYDSGFSNVKKIYSNKHAFAFLLNDGKVFVWGDETKGGSTGGNQPSLVNIKEIYNTDQAFLAHREDNKIIVWGDIDTAAGPASDFYSEVLEVFPSKYAFGISYLVQGTSIGYVTLTQYFAVIGSVAPGKENLSQFSRLGYTNFRGNRFYNTYPTEISDTRFEVGPESIGFFTSYSGPFDVENPPFNFEGGRFVIERNFYASQYAFHFTDSQSFYSIGNSPDDEHNSHNLKSLSTQSPITGNFRSKNYLFLDDIRKFDNRDSSDFNNTPVKNGGHYVSTRRATAFLTGPNTYVKDFSIPKYSPAQGFPYVVSLGHSSYGGAGTTFNEDENEAIIPPVGVNGYFKGLFSNEYAFCGIRFSRTDIGDSDDNINLGGGSRIHYDIITWGDANFGGESSSVDFSNTFANTKDLRYTHEGCHPDYCDQDIT